MTVRPKLQTLSVVLLSLACVAISTLPMADTGFPPTLWHLTPLFAVGLLFGVGMATWRAVLAVVAVRLIADFGIWAVTGKFDWAFYGPGQFLNYAGLMLLPVIGRFIKARRWTSVVAASLAGPVVFFLVSNFGVWLGSATRTLGDVYFAGLPFLRNSLIATPVWALVLFSPAVLRVLCETRGRADNAESRAVA